MFKKQHPKVGSRPGTLVIAADSPPPKIHVITYSQELVHEEDITDPAALKRTLDDKDTTWIDVQGFGDEPLIRQIAEIFSIHPRSRRCGREGICLANEQLPPRLRLLVLFMSIVLAIGFAVMGVANAWVHGLMLVSIAGRVHLLYVVLDDLDHPFHGVWNIDKSALEELEQRFTRELANPGA